MKKHLLSIIASIVICAALLIGCGGGGGGGGGNPSSPTKTGTLQGTVSLPASSLRLNIEKSASNTANIASNTIEQETALRASQSLEGTKVWLEGNPEINSTADKNGKYTLPNVPFGKNRVVANIKIGKDEYKWRSDIQNVENTTVIIVPQIVMQPAKTSISGIVYDAVSKKAIQGVIVDVWGQRSTSGSDGKYTVYNMPAGSWDVTYSKKGYQTFTSPMSFADGIETSGNFYLVPEGNNDPSIASYSGSVALTELLPAYKATNVSNQTTISAFYNGAIINTNYAKISFTSGNPQKVGGRFTFENDRVIYTHNEEWPANTKIAGSIGDLRDYFGKTIASISFEFTTTANIVKSLSPENNATKVEVDTPIVITFNAKMDTNQKLVDLIKVVDKTGKSLTLNSNQFSWSSSSDKNDVLTIKSIALQPDNSYRIQLSENLLDKNGNKLQGTRDFSFSTRGAVYLEFEPANYYHALSNIKFKVCGEGTVSNVSKANVSLSCKGIIGKLTVSGNYIVYNLDSNNQWPFGTEVTITLSNLTDSKSAKINDVSATFNVIKQTEILLVDSESEYNLKQDLIFDYTNKEYSTSLDLSNAKIQFANADVTGKFSFNKGQIYFKLDSNQIYPIKTTIKASVSGIKDKLGLSVKDYEFEFNTGYFIDGDGTEQNPYLITSPEDLNNLRYVSEKGYYFKQTTDIDLTAYGSSYDSGKGWMPIPSDSENDTFYGYYDGNNHKIINLYINRPKKIVGLFNTITGTVNNLGVEISANGIIGGTGAGLANSLDGMINDCWVGGSGKITCSDSCSGLIKNINSSQQIDNCYSTIDVEGASNVGGLFAYAQINKSIQNCYSSGNVQNSYNYGNTGGLIAETYGGKVSNCHSTSTLTGGANIGGLIGCSSNTDVNYSYFTGKITGNNKDSTVGGLIGDFSDTNFINHCYSTSDVSGGNAGGLIGHITSINTIVTNCYTTGNVSGINTAGGFVGDTNKTKIINCYSTGNVSNAYSSGSFIGYVSTGYDIIINCYSMGNVNGMQAVGGFVGDVFSNEIIVNLTNCYAGCLELESPHDGFTISRFVGYENNIPPFNITNCYANKNMKLIKNGITTQPGLQNPLPSTVALDGVDGANLPDNLDWKNDIFKDGYENGESFDDVWEIGTSGLPILKNMPGNPVQ